MFLQFLKAFTKFVNSPWVNNKIEISLFNAGIIKMLH